MKMKKILTIAMVSVAVAGFAVASVDMPFSQMANKEIKGMNDIRAAVAEGRAYLATDSFAAVTRCYYLVTGTTAPRVSWSFFCNTTDTTYFSASIAIKEAMTLSTGASTGTQMTAYNLRRAFQSTIPSKMVVSYSPGAVSDAGTELPTFVIPTNPANRAYFPGEALPWIGESGYVLKPSTKYHITITPSSAVPTHYVRFNWQE
jgi:hypothetical protein